MNILSSIREQLAGSSLGARLFGGGAAALAIKVASAGTSYLMLVAFANMLHTAEYGHFGYILNLSVLLSALFGLGLPTHIMRFWPMHMERGETAKARGLVALSLRALLAAALVLALFGALLSLVRPMTGTLGFSEAWLLTAFLAASFAFADYFSGALRAQGNTVWALAPRDIGWRVLSPALAFAVLLFSGTATARTAIYACVAVMLVVCALQAFKHLSLTQAVAGSGRRETDKSAWLKPLFPLWFSGVLYALIQQFDVIVVGTLLGSEQAGAYFAAQKTASLLGLAMIAGGMVAAPMMAASFHAGRKAELQRICRLLAIAIAGTTIAGLSFLALAGKFLLAIFDPVYVEAYGVLMVLGLGYTVDAMAGPSAYLMQMTKLEWTYLRVMAIVYAFVIALQFVFVPRYGIIAAAAATACGTVIWNILAIHLLRREIGIDPSVLSLLRAPSESKAAP